ncbi:MAG: hypothetical protein K2M73_11475 [Lachnospiraceae bacterium]|nr:hypothetical protein [Lachnospiraceae bacterium]MDE6698163.1 hypothetical protein [Lachnospiraceae bacterium]
MTRFDFNSMYGSGIDEEEEIAYFRSMYPVRIVKMQNLVEEACDKMEYDNSMMYDEYPDFAMVQKKCMELLNKLDEKNDNTKDMIEVLFINEIIRRRIRYRKIKGYC